MAASRVSNGNITSSTPPYVINSPRFRSPHKLSNSPSHQNAAHHNNLMLHKTVLVTGGAGYIGSHTVLQLLLGGFTTAVVDNLDNSSEVAIRRVRELAGEFGNNLSFHKVFINSIASFIQFRVFLSLYRNPRLFCCVAWVFGIQNFVDLGLDL